MANNCRKQLFAAHFVLLAAVLAICFALSVSVTNAESSDFSLYGASYSEGDEAFCLTPAEYWTRGGICFNDAVCLKDGMTADFEYRVSGGEISDLGYADGFVFILSPSYGLGGNGGALAFLGGSSTYGVEFDSYINSENKDPSGPHVGIIHGSVGNHVAAMQTSLVINNSWTKARVEYKNKALTLYINGTQYLTALAADLPEEVFIGFSSSTGAGCARHEVRNINVVAYEGSKRSIVTTGDKYVVTFDAAGGKVSEKSRQYGSGEVLGSLPVPSKTGYKFKGWYYSSGGKDIKVSSKTIVNNSMSLKAIWKIKSKKTYKATDISGSQTALQDR